MFLAAWISLPPLHLQRRTCTQMLCVGCFSSRRPPSQQREKLAPVWHRKAVWRRSSSLPQQTLQALMGSSAPRQLCSMASWLCWKGLMGSSPPCSGQLSS